MIDGFVGALTGGRRPGRVTGTRLFRQSVWDVREQGVEEVVELWEEGGGGKSISHGIHP